MRIPALTLQPLLENAIYHGIELGEEGGKVTILIKWTGKEVHIVITNPYHQYKKSKHKGNNMAVANIKERLQVYYGTKAILRVAASNHFFTTQISYPLTEAQAYIKGTNT